MEVDLFHNIEVTNHNVDQELEASPQELLIADGDSQIPEPESNPAHAEVDEEIDLTEIVDLEEAEEEVSDTPPAFTAKARIMTREIALKMSFVINKNVEPISVDDKRNLRKDRRLGRALLNPPKARFIRLRKNFRHLPGMR